MYHFKLKSLRVSWLFIIAIIQLLVGCGKDKLDIAGEIQIKDVEIGMENSKTGYPGRDFHIEARIIAATKIENVKLQIIPKIQSHGWTFAETYTEGFKGLKDPIFHEHFIIGSHARAGTYDLLLSVTDQNGTKKQLSDSIKIVIPVDETALSITNLSAKLKSSSTLNISANLRAPDKIDRVVVEVQSSAWTKEFTYTDAEMVNQTSFQFNKDIDISGSPAGHYHINITLYDRAGKSITDQIHLDK